MAAIKPGLYGRCTGCNTLLRLEDDGTVSYHMNKADTRSCPGSDEEPKHSAKWVLARNVVQFLEAATVEDITAWAYKIKQQLNTESEP